MPGLVTVHRTADALEAEILGDLLADAGIEARVLGARPGSAPFGLAVELEARVDVPAAQVAEARRIVEEHLDAARAAASEEDEAPRETRLSLLIAAGVVAICPGGGHLYARRPVVAAAIAAGELCSVALLAIVGGVLGAAAAAVLCALMAADLVGGMIAARAWNRGVRLTQSAQAFRGGLVLAGAAGLALVAGPLLERQASGRLGRVGQHQEMRSGAPDPRQLPFPLHLDFRR